MSRRRYLSTNISLDTRVNRLADEAGDFAALLYTWMIPHAADDGSLTADPETLLYLVVPARRDKSVADMRDAVSAMVRLGLVSNDGDLLHFPSESFYRYQTYVTDARRTASASIKERQRRTPQNTADEREVENCGENATSFSSSSSFSFSTSGEERAAAADAPPPEQVTSVVQERVNPVAASKSTRTKKPTGVGPIIDAFRDLELPDPVLIGSEPKAAMALLGVFPAGDIAQCWRDFSQGSWGDEWDRDHLSFRYLANENRMQKWQAWRDAGRPVREPHATSRRSPYPDARAYPSVANGYDLSAYDGIGHGPSTNGIGGRGSAGATALVAAHISD